MTLLEQVYQKFNEPVKRLTVGPVPSHPGMLEILGKQFFSTRDSFFVNVMKEIQPFLQESVGTVLNSVIFEHGSGSSGLCAVANHLLKPGDTVLCLNTGKFGERWVKIAKKRNCNIIEHITPWEKSINWKEIAEILLNKKPIAILMQHSETSTGAVHSLKDASLVIRENFPDTLLIVDAISSWGSLEIDMDLNQIDAVVGCSQKGFMLPTGLHLMSFSQRALQIIGQNDKNGMITDFSHSPLSDINEQLEGRPRFSMDSNALMALVYLKEAIIEKCGGWQQWFNDVHKRAGIIRNELLKINIKELSEAAGDVVIALPLQPHQEVKAIRKQLQDLGFEVNKSQDEARFRGIRIGNMGYITQQDVELLIKALNRVFQ